jgi:hypothetical protein
MASLRQQIYAVATADATLVAMLPGGTAAILGEDGSPPSANPTFPYLYLLMDAEVPWGPWDYRGHWQWWAYDHERAGYLRINRLLNRLQKLYPSSEFAATLYYDSESKEDIYQQIFQGFSRETADQAQGLLLRTASWRYRKTYRTDLVAS